MKKKEKINPKKEKKMKKLKPIVVLLSAVLLVAATILGTVAYLTDTSEVVNTFTVGNVKIKLDESVVDKNGNPTGGRDEKGNEYHLVPGQSYTKDPMVTVLKGSEETYVRMIVTLNCSKELDAIFAPNGAVLTDIFVGFDNTKWTYIGVTRDDAANTVSYEFRYYTSVKPAADADLELEPLFNSIKVPTFITGEQLETIKDLEISVEAHAIQASGFDNAAAAWAAFTK